MREQGEIERDSGYGADYMICTDPRPAIPSRIPQGRKPADLSVKGAGEVRAGDQPKGSRHPGRLDGQGSDPVTSPIRPSRAVPLSRVFIDFRQ